MLRETLFKHKYAEVFIARTDDEEKKAVGFALVSNNHEALPEWTDN